MPQQIQNSTTSGSTSPRVSCVIPSYKDPYLHNTIDSLLDNAEGTVEVIVTLDGYWPVTPIKSDPRVRIIHLGKTQGMRNAINCAVRVAKGEFILRTDEHCMFDKGWDTKLTKRFRDNWIVYPRRYHLDPVTWTVMDKPFHDYHKLVIDPAYGKWSGVNWRSREIERAHKEIDESMGMQGSCWIMKKSWWDKIGELDDSQYGEHTQDSIEMVFKTWQLGGRLMVNKTTWHAHKDRLFKRTHQYDHKSPESLAFYKFAVDKWKPYYNDVIAPRWGLSPTK